MSLVLLGLRRALPVRLVLVTLLLVAVSLVGLPDGSETASANVASPGAFALRGPWLVAAWFLLPVLAVRAAGLVERWRTSDRAWVMSRPVGEGKALAAFGVGTWLAGVLVVAGSAVAGGLAAQFASGSDASEHSLATESLPGARTLPRVAGTVSHPAVLLKRGQDRAAVALSLPRGATAIALRPRGLPSGGSAGVLTVRRIEGGQVREERRLPLATAGRAVLEVSNTEALVLELVSDGRTVCLLPASSIVALLPPTSLWRGSWNLGTLALCAWTLASALAVLLGLWLRPWLAGATALALCIAASERFDGLPGGALGGIAKALRAIATLPVDVLASLSNLERGWLPVAAPPLVVATTVVLALVAFAAVAKGDHNAGGERTKSRGGLAR